MKIYLVGFMGCGKSTTGKRLAFRCGYSFVDTDALFEQQHGSIVDFLAKHTEDKFRQEETKILRRTQEMDNIVVATGGGTPCFHDNMKWMLSQGKVVYIEMSPAALYSRLCRCKKERPLLASSSSDLLQTIEELFAQREPFYLQAHLKVSGIDLNSE
ncbi:MAG: shikimate kinase, partial [Bacteroidales bacterium]|nr:shikimate kinase [Bacteroidales bacterium]